MMAEMGLRNTPHGPDDARNEREAPPKRRILVVSQHFWPENFRINDIVRGFIQRGAEVDVLCGLPNYPMGEWFKGYRYTRPRRQTHGGAEIFRAGEIRRKNNTSLRIFLNYCSFPLYALFSLPRLWGRKYSAVLCYETSPVMALLPAILYARPRKIPLTGYVLDLWPDNLYSVLPVKSRLLRGLAYRVSRWFYRRCNRLAAISEQQAARLREMTKGAKFPPEIQVIPQYSEDFYGNELPDEALAARFSKTFNILFAGNISPAQDLENLVRALKLARQTPAGGELRVLILGGGMSLEALRAFVREQGMEDAVLFCGQVPPEQVPRWTGVADALFAGLSESKNLGLTVPGKIASYMAAGKPLLVATGGEGEAAAAECGGALVSPPGNAEALCENLLALRALPAEKRRAMGAAAKAYHRAHYNRAGVLSKLEHFILGAG